MYYTPEEAKEKWCPFAREEVGDGSLNRNTKGQSSNNCYCIGPDCIAWRWKGVSQSQMIEHVKDGGDKIVDDNKGCCGLVGGR